MVFWWGHLHSGIFVMGELIQSLAKSLLVLPVQANCNPETIRLMLPDGE
jgi:hypothetical protein